MQPRGFAIASGLEIGGRQLTEVRNVLRVASKHIQKDEENYQHLTGRVIDKTAGRNQLGLRNGK